MLPEVATSKMTVRSQTVIPKRVRERLGLKPGDMIRYILRDDVVIVDRLRPQAEPDPFAGFTEWDSEADRHAYADL